MATKCYSLVKGRRIRVTKLDDCYRPVFGEYSQAVSKGFISVALTANTSDSDEINVTNAAGEKCVYEPAETSFTGYAVEITFCEVDPELYALVTGQDTYSINDDVSGFTVGTDKAAASFGLELWAGVAGGDACSDPNAEGNYGYLLLPAIKGGIVGDFTVENNAVTFTLTGGTTRDGNGWGVGPYNNVVAVGSPTTSPSALPTALGSQKHLLQVLTTQAPPDVACGARPLLDPDAPELTSISAVVAGMVATFTPDPDDLVTPFWYDFGDGTWDYLASGAMGATAHTYPAAGVYTARASTNGTWVTTTVTIV